MRSSLRTSVVATLLLATAPVVFAQAFPGKTVRLVMALPVGGSVDAQARIIAPPLSERWKQQIIIDPRPGGATMIGTEHVAKSPPDGHTLLFTSIQYAYLPALFARLPYDPLTDLVPITVVTNSPEAIISHPSLPVKNIKELIALARVRPLNMGTPGNELTTQFFNMLTKSNIVPVPYKGGAPFLIDLMGGYIELGTGGLITLQPPVRAGRARLLGIASRTPSLIFPEAPLIPRDVPDYEFASWFGLFAPRGTPNEVVRRIRDDVAAVLQMPRVKERLLEIGGEPSGEAVDEFAARVRTDIARWQKVARAAGIKPQ